MKATRQAGAVHPHDRELPVDTVIAGLYEVKVVKRWKFPMGSYVGDVCYICEDRSIRDPPEEDIIRQRMGSGSLRGLRLLVASAVASLCSGAAPPWAELERELQSARTSLFFGQQPRSWWLKLEGQVPHDPTHTHARAHTHASTRTHTHTHTHTQVQHAKALATGESPSLLRAAYLLRELAPPAPLCSDPARPRVFVKTFKEYKRKVVAEIRRCSAKAPDFGRDRLQVGWRSLLPWALPKPYSLRCTRNVGDKK